MVVPDDILFSQRDYVAPTVYSDHRIYVSNLRYYSTLDAAINRYKFLNNQGGYDVPPAGVFEFPNDGKDHTVGINCDFYILKDNSWQLTSYKYLKTLGSPYSFPPMIFRFLLPTGTGPYYMIFDKYYLAVSALSIKSVPPEKIAELDEFYRAVQLMKYRYNALVGLLNTMSKRQLNSIEQQIFNEGILILNSFNQQIATIKGLELSYSQTGAVGLPILLIIVVIAILATATAWTVSTIVAEKEKTKQIAESYDMTKWIATKKVEIEGLVTSGTISRTTANSIFKNLDDAQGIANKVANNAATDSKGIFDNLASIAMWGAIGFVGYSFFNSRKSSSNAS